MRKCRSKQECYNLEMYNNQLFRNMVKKYFNDEVSLKECLLASNMKKYVFLQYAHRLRYELKIENKRREVR